jgi:hypothetical protein
MKIRFISYLTIVLAALLLGACNSIMDDEVCADRPSDTATPVQIGFTLTTGDVSSRAITEGEDPGSERENYIDIANNNFRILLFNTDNKYLTALKVNRITQTGDDGTTYYVEGELDEAYTDFKLVVLANWGTYADNWTSETTIADVCEATYSYSSSFNIDNDLIPMYGVQTYNNVELRANLLTELPTDIDLLRAMAKIQVTCNAEGFELSEVKLHRYNTSGYCAPTGVDEDTTTDWEYEENAVCNHATHIPANSVSELSLAFTDTETEDGFIIYVPEFDNKTNTEERSYIEVSLIHTDDKSPVNLEETNIYFCLYDEENGTPTVNSDFDIVRNHWYKYDITNVDDGELIFQYRVRFWNVKESVIGWNPTGFLLAAWNNEEGNKEKAETDATIGDTEAVYCYVCNPGYNEEDKQYHTLKDGTSGAAFSFTLQVPAGATWKGYLTKDEYFYFSYSQYWDGTKHAVSTGIARKDEYQIKIQARHAWTEYEDGSVPSFDAPNTENGNRFDDLQGKGGIYTDFYIIVSPDGNESNDYKLKINPNNAVKEDKTYYKNRRRFAGPDEYHVRIWQLKAKEGIANYGELFNDSEDIKEFRK